VAGLPARTQIHDAAGIGRHQAGAAGDNKGGDLGDDMIVVKRQHHALPSADLATAAPADDWRDRNSASRRRQQHSGLETDLAICSSNHEAMAVLVMTNRTLKHAGSEPAAGCSETSTRSEQRQELFSAIPPREAGHSRVPAPPHRMSGMIRLVHQLSEPAIVQTL